MSEVGCVYQQSRERAVILWDREVVLRQVVDRHGLILWVQYDHVAVGYLPVNPDILLLGCLEPGQIPAVGDDIVARFEARFIDAKDLYRNSRRGGTDFLL